MRKCELLDAEKFGWLIQSLQDGEIGKTRPTLLFTKDAIDQYSCDCRLLPNGDAMIAHLIVVGAVMASAGAVVFLVFYLLKVRRETRRRLQTQFRQALIQRLRKVNKARFSFEAFVKETGVPPDLARQGAQEVYAAFFEKLLEQNNISDKQRQKLTTLSEMLALDASDVHGLEQSVKESAYSQAVTMVVADTKIEPHEAVFLDELRKKLGLSKRRGFEISCRPSRESYVTLFRDIVEDGFIDNDELQQLELHRQALGITDEQARDILGDEGRHAYRKLFCGVIDDGHITPAEIQQMERFRQALGISGQEGSDILRHDSLQFYRESFYQMAQDGDITQDDENKLTWLQDFLGLRLFDVQPYLTELGEIKRLSAYRNGDLPSRRTAKLLEGGEICHWEDRCNFHWQTATRSKSATGELIVTNRRLVFSSPVKSFEFRPSKIVDVVLYHDGLQLRTSVNRGNGSYYVASARDLEAILAGLVRKHKFLTCENFSSSQTRHIPDSVKREVWARDGGRCVRCGATEYLEFDHIIPHSSGGANTVLNVQILCRKCNLLKSDRI